jgi:two-component system OmpR family response regulator
LPNQRAKAHPTGKVLLVEDEKDLREILCEHLTANGWDVHSAHDADAAIVSFEATRPLVAVVDLGLPGRSGLELIGILRKLSKGSPLGVVALTGQAFPEDAERCMQAGADRFLTKPTTLRKTESVLRELHALMIGSESGDGERVDGAMAPQ